MNVPRNLPATIFWILSEAESEGRDVRYAGGLRCSVEQPSPCVRSILSGARTSPSRNALVFATSAAARELERSGYTIILFTERDGDGIQDSRCVRSREPPS
jgi:hypothetical protein